MDITPTWIRIHKELVIFILKKVKDRVIAEDLLHDVYLKAYVRSKQLRDADKINGWIYRIAQTTIADYYRNRERSPLIESDDSPDSSNYNECVSDYLASLVQTLPTKYRQVLEWSERENLSQLQISERLQISYAGTRSRVQRARKMLRARFEAMFFVQTDSYGNVTVCENRKNSPCDCREMHQSRRSSVISENSL